MLPTGLTIAGSDSCGGAGIQADIKTFSALGVYGMSVITAITAQNTQGVTDIRELDAAIIRAQINAIYTDIPVGAVKIGMLSSTEIIETVAAELKKHQAGNIVLDPVMISKSGSHLLRPEAVNSLKEYLIPLAQVVTPNLHEAAELVGFVVDGRKKMEEAARRIHAMGARHVVIKGGHLTGPACDVFFDGNAFNYLENERIDTKHTHGTGCTFSSAIAAGLAQKMGLYESIQKAKAFIIMAIRHGFALGHGIGPTHHFYNLYHNRNRKD